MLKTHNNNSDQLSNLIAQLKREKKNFHREILVLAGTYGCFDTQDSFEQYCKLLEKFGFLTQSSGLILAINAHVWGLIYPLTFFGTEQQKREILPAALAGNILGGHAITEPGAGSDLNKIELKAEKSKSGYYLTGHKRYITNAPVSDYLVVYARYQDSLSAFLVNMREENILIENKNQIKACSDASMSDVIFNACLVPEHSLLGKEGGGLTLLNFAMEYERAFIFAGLIGVLRWHLARIKEHVKYRKVANTNLSQMQHVSFKLSELFLKFETMCLWITRCATLKDSGKRITLESSYTKLYCSEALSEISIEILHLYGALGFEDTHHAHQLVNDSLASKLFSGSSEVQKNIIASLNGVY